MIRLQSFALYILVAMDKNSHLSSEISLKYFIYGSLASCILLFGVALVFVVPVRQISLQFYAWFVSLIV